MSAAFEVSLLFQDDSMYGALHDSLKGPIAAQLRPPSILLRIFQLFKWDIIWAMLIKCVSDLLQFANPQLLR